MGGEGGLCSQWFVRALPGVLLMPSPPNHHHEENPGTMGLPVTSLCSWDQEWWGRKAGLSKYPLPYHHHHHCKGLRPLRFCKAQMHPLCPASRGTLQSLATLSHLTDGDTETQREEEMALSHQAFALARATWF